MINSKEFIDIIDSNGIKETYELITRINSNKDDKVYFILTDDKIINDEVNIKIGYTNKITDKIEFVKDPEEMDYVFTLISSIVEGD